MKKTKMKNYAQPRIRTQKIKPEKKIEKVLTWPGHEWGTLGLWVRNVTISPLLHEGLAMKSQKRNLKNVGMARSDFENF